MASLTDLAEQKVLDTLTNEIQKESQQSIFAVGGSIQITGSASKFDQESGKPLHGNNFEDDFPLMVHSKEVSSVFLESKPVVLRWDSGTVPAAPRKVTFPLSENDLPAFQQLISDCQPATFGLGNQNVLDEAYRKAGKIDETCFSTNFNPYELGIVEAAARILTFGATEATASYSIRAELYKLNVYSAPSGRFKAHVDTPRSKEQVGSLVVCLPSIHQGGQLVLRHEGREKVFDWSGEDSAKRINWAAFFSDCEHEVLEVNSGHRITLTYNLYAIPTSFDTRIDLSQTRFYPLISTLLDQPGFCRTGRKLGFYCTHGYPSADEASTATSPTIFKGIDKMIYDCFSSLGFEVTLQHKLDIDPLEEIEERVDTVPLNRLRPKELEVLHEHFEEVENHGEYESAWERRDKRADLALMSKALTPLVISDYFDEDQTAFDRAQMWDSKYTVEAIHWLNKPSHRQRAIITGAYGNEPSIDIHYANLAIVLHVPPFHQRK